MNISVSDTKVRVLLDYSVVPSNSSCRTGLARVACSLVETLQKQPNLEVFTTAWSSIASAYDFCRLAENEPSARHLPPALSRMERAYGESWVKRLSDGRGTSRWFVTLGQAMNLVRDPIRGVEPTHFDLVHSTYARFPRQVRRRFPRRMITVHDLTPLKLPPSLFGPNQLGVTRRILDSILPTDHVVCVSESTRNDFLEYSGHPTDACSMIYNGVDMSVFRPEKDPKALAQIRERFGLRDAPFLLTLSSMAPHKNLAFLLKAWARSGEANRGCRLVIAGGADRKASALLDQIARGMGGDHGVTFTGFLADEDVARLASACNAFLFPSLYEGFGLPVLEAMACGAPVLCSNTSSLPEVVGGAGTVLDPRNESTWVEAMRAVLNGALPRMNPSLPHITQAARFAWSRSADAYAELYRKLTIGRL